MIKDNIEKGLKRFLKGKKLGYSVSLLVSFLITGAILSTSLHANEIQEILTEKELLMKQLQEEEAKINELIKAKDEEINKKKSLGSELIKEGDWYSKGFKEQNQVILSFYSMNTKAFSNKTAEEFKETTDAIKEVLGNVDEESLLVTSNGVIVGEQTSNPLSIDIGANVKATEVVLPEINVTVNANVDAPDSITVVTPNVIISGINGLTPPTPGQPPIIGNITAPITPVITPPKAVNTITVTAPQTPNPVTPTDKNIVVTPPATPGGFEPTQIVPPTAPSTPVIVPIQAPNFTSNSRSNGNGTSNRIDNAGNNGTIEMVAVTDGDFKIKRTGDTSWEYNYTGYDGMNVWAVTTASVKAGVTTSGGVAATAVAANGSWNNYNNAGSTSYGVRGFQSLVGSSIQATGYNNGTFLYTRPLESSSAYLGEFVHMDTHGTAPQATQRAALETALNEIGNAQKKAAVLASWDDLATLDFRTAVDGAFTDTSAFTYFTWINSGKIVIEGGTTSLTNNYIHGGSITSKSTALNEGEVIFQPYYDGTNYYQKYTAAFVISNDASVQNQGVMYNGATGTIDMYTQIASAYFSNALAGRRKVSFVNRGEVDLYGEGSAGIYIKTANMTNEIALNTSDFAFNTSTNTITAGAYKPIVMYGDSSTGLYIQIPTTAATFTYESDQSIILCTGCGSHEGIEVHDLKSVYAAGAAGPVLGHYAIQIGAPGVGNQTFTTNTVSGSTAGQNLTDYDVNTSDTENGDFITGSAGIVSNANINLDSHSIEIYDKTIKSIGVVPNEDGVALELGGGWINLYGGTENIGIFAAKNGSTVTSTGDIKIEGGTGNIAIFASNGSTVTMDDTNTVANTLGNVTVGTATYTIDADGYFTFDANGTIVTSADKRVLDTVAMIAIGKSNITIGEQVNMDLKSTVVSKDTIGIFAEDSTITISNAGTITVEGIVGDDGNGTKIIKGTGLLAMNGGTINAERMTVNVINGSVGVASIGKGTAASNINITGATLLYDGNGYAVYSDEDGSGNGGTVNLTNAILKLYGNSTAFDLNLATGAVNPYTLTGTTIQVHSDDVIVFNLKNATGLNTTGLQASIVAALGGAANLIDTTNSTATDYKTAAVDGGTIAVGNLDRSGTETDTAPELADGYFYYNRFLGQRLNATATGSTISAILDNTEANSFNAQVNAFEMNSSSTAANNTEAAINLVGSTVIADRTDAGDGAIGLYINYGTINVDSGSKILVETGVERDGTTAITGDVVNSGAVGVYSVNGSNVTNSGAIIVNGTSSIGILGQAYRTDSTNAVIVDEFGSDASGNKGQGKIGITNSGTITLEGDGTVGIYAENNSTTTTNTDSNITNTSGATITVGNTTATETSVGIYATGTTITNSGTIIVGTEGVGIYAKTNGNSEGSQIASAGIISLGNEGIAMYVDSGSDVTAPTLTLQANGTITNGVTGLFYKGNDGIASTTAIGVDASSFNKGTVIYGDDAIVTYNALLDGTADIIIGTEGVGFVSTNGSVITNAADVAFGATATGAAGMYATGASTAINTGSIDVNVASNLGMVSKNGGTIENTGSIALNTNDSVGMYAENGIVNLSGNNITVGTTSSKTVGIYAKNNSTINITGATTYTASNEKENVYIYADTSNVIQSSTLDIDGISPDTTDDSKTVGIYLINGGTYTATTPGTDTILVSNQAIGMYSNGDTTQNTITGINITVDGTNSVASDTASTIGIYSTGNLSLSGTVTVNNNGLGIYAGSGSITVGTLLIENDDTANVGTGIYLANGSELSSGTVNVSNTNTTNKFVGLYYTADTATTATNGADVVLSSSNNVGIYANEILTLTNSGDITEGTTGYLGNIGVMATNGAAYKGQGNITLSSNDGIGILSSNGTATNESTITMDGTAQNTAIGMLAQGKAGETSTIVNTGTIKANGNVGMLLSNDATYTGANVGTNTGNINAAIGTGIFIQGTGTTTNSTFDGNGGSINVELPTTVTGTGSYGLGISLNNTDAGTITNTGTLNIHSYANASVAPTNVGTGIGVYADTSAVDFVIDTLNTTSYGEIALYTKGATTISGTITASNKQTISGVDYASTAVYFNDTAAVVDGSTISAGDSGTAIYLGEKVGTIGSEYVLGNVTDGKSSFVINTNNGIGLYLGTDGTDGAKVVANGTINVGYDSTGTTVGGGIGVYVQDNTAFTNGNLQITVATGGIGVYIKGTAIAVANIGMTAAETMSFTLNGGTGIINDGGTLNLGSHLTVDGTGGSLASTLDGDLNSAATINISGNSQGLLGQYTSATVALDTKTIMNSGIITSNSGAIGIAAIKGGTSASPSIPTGTITITNTGTITASGEGTTSPSIGIYSEVADIDNSNIINAGEDGIGIFAEGYKDITVNSGDINLTGENSVGIIAKKSVTGIDNVDIDSTATKTIGIILDEISNAITVGTTSADIHLGTGGIGIAIKSNDNNVNINNTNIVIGDSTENQASVGLYVSETEGTVSLTGTTSINVGNEGVAIYADNGSTINGVDFSKIILGTDGIYLYSDNSTVNLTASTINITGGTGFYLIGSGSHLNTSGTIHMNVSNGGIGIYSDGANLSGANFGSIILYSGVDENNRTIGVYFKNSAPTTFPSVTIASGSSNTIGYVLEGMTTTTTIDPIVISGGSNNVGISLLNGSKITTSGVTVSGDNNVGIYSSNNEISIGNNGIDVSSAVSKDVASTGIYLIGSKYDVNGDIKAGNNTVGLYSKEGVSGVTNTVNGNITVGDAGLGIYNDGNTLNITSTSINVASNKALGVYGKNGDLNVSIGTMTVGEDGIGIASLETGNVTYSGAATILKKAVGIYKKGSGNITTTSGSNMALGDISYGIYADSSDITIINNGNLSFADSISTIGIYSNGKNTVYNNGNITVGKTYYGESADPTNLLDNLNSVGIYMKGETNVTNNGIITVNKPLSLGVYGEGAGNKFTNNGDMKIDNGGVGVLVRGGAEAVNNGNIYLGSTTNSDGTTVGMAAYTGSKITNTSNGYIEVRGGVGILIGEGATLVNEGTIKVFAGGTGIGGVKEDTPGVGNVDNSAGGNKFGTENEEIVGSGIIIDGDKVTIKDYTGISGSTLATDGTLNLDGVNVDVSGLTTGTPLFEAAAVTGEVNILPDFTLTGNGYWYEIDNFVSVASTGVGSGNLEVTTSPLWLTSVSGGKLIMVKKPYAELVIGDQFDELYTGLDNILITDGSDKDKEILKNLNYYLTESKSLESDIAETLAETRGDIYATVQRRMEYIDDAFDTAFYDLVSTANLNKNSGKYSVIYVDGSYEDETVGIDSFDYNVTGLMYMKENEKEKQLDKTGYSLGFALSSFEFDDIKGSKEDTYSLRGGVHRVKQVFDKVEWLTQFNGAVNLHKTERNMYLGDSNPTITNDADYLTYTLNLTNRVSKLMLGDESKNLTMYGQFEMEYGYLSGLEEDGNLILEIDKNDYYSLKPVVGLEGNNRYYLGNDNVIHMYGRVFTGYELGEVYEGNKARLVDGDEGYYELITPAKDTLEGKLILGVSYENIRKYKVGLEFEGSYNESQDGLNEKISLKLNYIF